MEIPHMLLNVLYNKTCFLCYKTSPNMTDVAEVFEIHEQYSTKVLKLTDIVHYLFPSLDIICSQACSGCSDLLIKMYIIIKKNNFIKSLLDTFISHFNKNIKKATSKNRLTVSLTLQSKEDITNESEINHDISKQKNVSDISSEINDFHIMNEENRNQQDPHCTYKKMSQIKTEKDKRLKKYYNCNNCNYRSLCKGTLEGHINKHHIKIRPFVCDICYKSFYTKSNLMEHSQIHKKVGEICELCGELFSRRQSLVDHLRLHTNDKRYKCEMCDKFFVNSGRRLDHMKRSHLEKNECCMFCNKKFGLKKELIRHVKSVHA